MQSEGLCTLTLFRLEYPVVAAILTALPTIERIATEAGIITAVLPESCSRSE